MFKVNNKDTRTPLAFRIFDSIRHHSISGAFKKCYLTKNFSSQRYGASNSNQRIENWWSQFQRSFSEWAIDHFKELIPDGKFIPDSMFHMHVYGLYTLNLFKRN